jgi:ribosomal-protein-serine acetyltransferase
MTRSCEALIKYAFEELKLNKVQIKCGVDNIRSCNIPKQLKFTFEGIERDGEYLNKRFMDLKVYSLLRKEWKKSNS